MEFTIITFLVIISAMYHGHVRSENVIPEGVILTQPHVVFWEGQDMSSIPCRFKGSPSVLSWMKGESVNTAEELLTFSNGVKGGLGIDEGILDLTDDYTLVFKSVELGTAGKYICRVVNTEGILIHNNTIVIVHEFQMQTTPTLTVWKGETASLPCGLPYTPYRAQWVNKSSEEVVASYTDGIFSSPSDEERGLSMEEDFSLTIREVNVLDQSTLKCEIFTHDSRSWENFTELTVNAYGDGPSFDDCMGLGYCRKEVNVREFRLTCIVRGVKPDVTMALAVAGNSKLRLLPASYKRREDGTNDQILYANVSIDLDRNSETFTCTADGEALHGIASATITVEVMSGKLPTAILIVVIIMSIAIVAGLVFCLVFKRKCFHKTYGDGQDTEQGQATKNGEKLSLSNQNEQGRPSGTEELSDDLDSAVKKQDAYDEFLEDRNKESEQTPLMHQTEVQKTEVTEDISGSKESKDKEYNYKGRNEQNQT
ncbi:uncharacterized protein [Diadema antillarum]|uniref:uncharacterized protein n=1 Tax=Diadema antillarum TaxID=105358 RepID=UPI003A83869A